MSLPSPVSIALKFSRTPEPKKRGSDRVVTITGINVTLVGNAIIASYYVVIITSIDGRKVFDTNDLLKLFISNDYVFSIAGIYKSFVDDAVSTLALDRVITITSIESGGGAIVDAAAEGEVASTTDSVVAVSSIEDTTDADSSKAARASYYVVTLARIERAGGDNGQPFPPAVIVSLPSPVLNVPVL
jgi:hypothetical protein